MFCKNCGTQLADDVKFCPSCGTDNSAEASAPEAATEPVVENVALQTPPKSILPLGIIGFLLTFGPAFLIGFILTSIANKKGKKFVTMTGQKLSGGAKVGYILATIANVFAGIIIALALVAIIAIGVLLVAGVSLFG